MEDEIIICNVLITLILHNAEIYFLNILHLLKLSLVMSVRIPVNGNRDLNKRTLITIVIAAR